MSEMRRRDGKLKILHTIIGDFGRILRQAAEIEEIDSILTGEISPSKSYREVLQFQYFTDNGLKLLAKTTTAVQEIFIVSGQPDLVLDELVKAGFVDLEQEDVKHGDPHKRRNRGSRRENRPEASDRHRASRAEASHPVRPGGNKEPVASASGEPLTLRQRLAPDTLAALMKVKDAVTPRPRVESLEEKKAAATAPARKPTLSQRTEVRRREAEEDNFAALFEPQEDEESFAELLARSKLDPKHFKS